MASPVSLCVFRWTAGQAERLDEYRVTAAADTTVLDALVEIQRRRDPSLAFRYACRVGMCGSCAMVVNGRERWACRTRLVSLGAGAIRVRPLYRFPLLHDLVVALAPFTARLRAGGGEAGWRWRPGDGALARCHGQGACTEVCPMGLAPTTSIVRLRQMATRKLLGLG